MIDKSALDKDVDHVFVATKVDLLRFVQCWHDAADVAVMSGFDANYVVFPLGLAPRLCHCHLGALRAIIVRAIVRRTVLVAHGLSERDGLRCNLCAHCSVPKFQKFSFGNHPQSVPLIKKMTGGTPEVRYDKILTILTLEI